MTQDSMVKPALLHDSNVIPAKTLLHGYQIVIANERSECGNLGKTIKNAIN
ncbi:MAG: hypothetical protein ACRYE8_00135 [Janthinobacterium lividum]